MSERQEHSARCDVAITTAREVGRHLNARSDRVRAMLLDDRFLDALSIAHSRDEQRSLIKDAIDAAEATQ